MPHSNLPGSGMKSVIYKYAGGADSPPVAPDDVDALVDRICFVNFRQWQLEDVLREPGISAENAFATIKRIQASNAERTQLMEQIDRYYVNVTAENPASVHSENRQGEESTQQVDKNAETVVEFHETLGQMLDILSILYVRRYHTEQLLEQGFEHHPGNGWLVTDAITAIDQQIALCERSFGRLQALFLAGKAILPPLSHFKLYGAPEKNAAQQENGAHQPVEETP